MKTRILIQALVFAISLSVQTAYSQLSGTALLAGQTNHSGIKVKFTAASGTALTDSCLTGASGNYSINISGGLYHISMSMSGYQTIMYNNANVTTLTNTVVLQTQTLAVGTVSYVSGAVSGNWTGNVIYMVSGNLDVANGTTLTIQPGTEIKFLGSYSLTVNGVLNASGTAGSPIRFLNSVPTSTWSEVNLYGGPNTLDHCEFSNFSGINNWNAAFRISNCRIVNASRVGIQLVDGSGTVENNDIINAPLGISGFANSATVSCNRISSPLYKNDFNVISRGINIMGSDRFTDNEVWDCQEGIHLRDFSSTPLIKDNYVHDNTMMGMYIEANNSSTLLIANNTLDHNHFGIYGYHPGLMLSNNVITSSSIAVMGSGMSCDHNLIFGCSFNFSLSSLPPGLGQIVNTNSNGDPIDSYYNLFIDPDYGTRLPSFQPGSPVLNAGNTTHGADIGAGVASLCFSTLTTGLRQESLTGFKAYPNPSFGLFTIELPGAIRVRIYSVAGVEILNREVNEDRISVNISGQAPGIYFCEIQGRSGRERIKLVNL